MVFEKPSSKTITNKFLSNLFPTQFNTFQNPRLDFQSQFVLIKHANKPSLMISFVSMAFFSLAKKHTRYSLPHVMKIED